VNTFLLIDPDGNKFGSLSAGSATVCGPGDITGRLHDETAFALSYECAMELYRQLGNALIVAATMEAA
jgi:hypothetical protein